MFLRFMFFTFYVFYVLRFLRFTFFTFLTFYVFGFSNLNLNIAPKIPKKSEFLAANSNRDLDSIVVGGGGVVVVGGVVVGGHGDNIGTSSIGVSEFNQYLNLESSELPNAGKFFIFLDFDKG